MTEPTQQLEPKSFAPELDRYARLGTWLAAAETKNPTETQRGAAAALRLAYAESLNLPLMAATELSVIAGRLVVSAQLLRALAEQRGYRVERVESTPSKCVARVWYEGQPLGETVFTIEDAKRAGLIRDRSAWQTHPARMLWARASAFAIKDFAPMVALGLVTEDEAAEIAEQQPVDPHPVRAKVVIGPEYELPPEEPAEDFGPVTDPDLEDEPPQDQLHVDDPVGSTFQAPEPRKK